MCISGMRVVGVFAQAMPCASTAGKISLKRMLCGHAVLLPAPQLAGTHLIDVPSQIMSYR